MNSPTTHNLGPAPLMPGRDVHAAKEGNRWRFELRHETTQRLEVKSYDALAVYKHWGLSVPLGYATNWKGERYPDRPHRLRESKEKRAMGRRTGFKVGMFIRSRFKKERLARITDIRVKEGGKGIHKYEIWAQEVSPGLHPYNRPPIKVLIAHWKNALITADRPIVDKWDENLKGRNLVSRHNPEVTATVIEMKQVDQTLLTKRNRFVARRHDGKLITVTPAHWKLTP